VTLRKVRQATSFFLSFASLIPSRHNFCFILQRIVDDFFQIFASSSRNAVSTGPGSTPYRTLLAPQPTAASSLHDVFRAAHPVATRDEGTVHFFTGWRGGRRMDWILASSHFETIDAEIDHTRGSGGYPSDHFPVTTTLRGPAATAPQPQATLRE
jgi:hypothetical protein